METVINVGLAELAISDQPQTVLVAFGLGSCVAVAAYDPQRRVGAMLHAMLPQHRNADRNRTKFADTGIVEMLERLTAMGVRREGLIWRIAGGAQMLTAPGLSDRFNIGAQNAAVARDVLARMNARLVGQDVGGYEGRTVRLYIADGSATVRNVSGVDRPL